MVLDLSLELEAFKGKYKDVEIRLKEKQEGETRIMPFYFLHLITIAPCSLRTLHFLILLIHWLEKLVLVI